jgi:hypothetical protein
VHGLLELVGTVVCEGFGQRGTVVRAERYELSFVGDAIQEEFTCDPDRIPRKGMFVAVGLAEA